MISDKKEKISSLIWFEFRRVWCIMKLMKGGYFIRFQIFPLSGELFYVGLHENGDKTDGVDLKKRITYATSPHKSFT
ncbi:MAG: hypothetical protein ACLRSW_02540 [Christensenellaceae bacterium]